MLGSPTSPISAGFPSDGKRKLRIAQIAPLVEDIPPKLYGGVERTVSWLTEALVKSGHDVTLFASGESITSARLVPTTEKALRLNPTAGDWVAVHKLAAEEVFRRRKEFDIIHSHIDYLALERFSQQNTPFITTLHGRLDIQEYNSIFYNYGRLPYVSLSNEQRRPLPCVNWAATIPPGLPCDLLTPRPCHQEYAAFLGRISPEKGVDKAIRIAGKAGLRLLIAAKIDNADRRYWESEIEPLIRASPWVEYIGEIGDSQKAEFLSHAHALLFPIDWPEAFGLVMIESMACGTPTVAFNCGSVSEVIDDGISGFIVNDEASAVNALSRLSDLDRTVVRETFERRFTAQLMAERYLNTYANIAAQSKG